MPLYRRLLVVGASALAVTACGNGTTRPIDTSKDCAGGVRVLRIYVRDSLTDAFAASGAEVSATIGTHTETAASVPREDSLPILLGSFAGSYTVTVQKAGYRDWVRAPITVPVLDTGACRGAPVPTRVDARLSREP